MATVRPRGSYGVDAPWVPCLWAGLSVVYAAITVAAVTVWAAPGWAVAVLVLVTLVFAAAAIVYVHATVRGKFVIWDRLLSGVRIGSGGSALDLGCGHGMVAVMAALRFPSLSVTGIDLWRSVDQSGNTPEAAEQNATINGVGDRVRFETGDMTELPYPDGTFELVTASLAIHNIRTTQARRKAVAEAVRVLAPGGTILIADLRRTAEYAAELRAAGLTVETRPLGWRMWWSGPWTATTAVTARAARERMES